ncbi:alpha/beta fold hydrolase [Sporosarcina highlanderae]|uniref:Alpha/beta hydrolase n=1 Tax=Sporosarcina highlanderae TaxID=3035916 RepID=A0ABT8JNQ3_9BACL|nr:alpha/beta hydrolase [Sporosarcina highlanderae]MDN4606032.1 alpha/beta hydrolase [Sporosarcina highlanderae]
MNTDSLVKNTLSVIGFPFTLINRLINQKKKVKELGQLVEVNSRNIHTIVSGNNDSKPTVILDAGLSCCSIDWYYIQPELSKFARVLSFDRAGYGWSSPSKGTNTSEEVVDDLLRVLEKLAIEPPYILVGHSFGGLNMRLFASKYPDQVEALVLVDAVHEKRYLSNEWDEFRKKGHQKNMKLFRLGYITSGVGLPRLLKQPVGRKYLPSSFQKQADYIGYHPNAFEAVYKEFLYSEQSAKQVATSKPLRPDLPIRIISSNNSDPTWIEHQELLCNLSNNTKQIQTDNSHSIHLENPELVIHTIQELFEAVELPT